MIRSTVQTYAMIVFVATLAFAFSVVVAVATVAQAQTHSIRVATFPTTAQAWPVYVALDKGFFEAHDVEVDYTAISGGVRMAQALATGALDVAASVPEGTMAANDGAGRTIIEVVSGSTNFSPFEVIVSPEITSLDQLKGQLVGATALNSGPTYQLRKLLEAAGLEWGEYEFAEIGSTGERFQALRSGHVKMTLLSQPQSFLAKDEGFRYMGMASDAFPMIGNVWNANAAWARQNSETLVRFLRALHDATDWLYDQNNRAEAIELLIRETNARPEHAEASYDLYINELELFSKRGDFDLEYVENLAVMMAEAGSIRQVPDLSELVNMEYNELAKQP